MRNRLLSALFGCLALGVVLWAQTYTLSPSPWFTGLDNNGVIVSGGCLWTYAAGTTTPIATYTSASGGTPNSNPIILDSAGRSTIYLLGGQSYKFVLENVPCSVSSHGVVLRTQDAIGSVPTSASNVTFLGTAGVNLTAEEAVYLSDGSGGQTQGLWYAADSTNVYSSTAPVVGISTAAIASASMGAIQIGGQVTGLSVLAVGSDYFLSTAGALTTTPPSNARLFGRADSATTLILRQTTPQVSTTLPGGLPLLPGTSTTFFNGNGAFTAPALQLVLVPSTPSPCAGSNQAAITTQVCTFAIPTLTSADKIQLYISQSGITQTTANPILYSVTDAATWVYTTNAGNAIQATGFTNESITCAQDQSSTTTVVCIGLVGHETAGTSTTGTTQMAAVTTTTPWTHAGGFTIALRSGAGGVTAGGTWYYAMTVFVVKGE